LFGRCNLGICRIVAGRAASAFQHLGGATFMVYPKIMASSISDRPKKRGRPATGRDPYLGFRSPPSMTEAIDAWISAQPKPQPSRSVAIRSLLQRALAADLEDNIAVVKASLAVPDVEKAPSPKKGMEMLRRGHSENQLRSLRQKRTFRKPPKTPKR
jgi:hypothetical protein